MTRDDLPFDIGVFVTIAMREDSPSEVTKPRLAHHRCQQRHHAATGNGPVLLSAREYQGLA